MYKNYIRISGNNGHSHCIMCPTKTRRKQKAANNKVLIAYFSATGTTAGAAENCLRLQVENFMKLLQPNPIQMLTSIGITNNRAVRWK